MVQLYVQLKHETQIFVGDQTLHVSKIGGEFFEDQRSNISIFISQSSKKIRSAYI